MKNKNLFHIDSSPPSSGKDGPLSGKTISLQPNMSVKGWPTEAGSPALLNFIALEDASVVERIKTAGGSLKGSTRMSELGFGLDGDTAAQSVADDVVDVALMTDTMGESRVAASAAGLFGFKPSYGIISRLGLIGLIPSMECYGVIAHTIEEIAAVTGAITGPDDRDPSMSEDNIPDFAADFKKCDPFSVIGVVKEFVEGLEPVDSGILESAVSKLEKCDLSVRKVSVKDLGLARTVHNIIGSVEASSSGGKYDSVRYGYRCSSSKNWNEMYIKSRGEMFGLPVKTYMLQGAYFQYQKYAAFENACRIRGRLIRQIEEAFKNVDALVMMTRRTGIQTAGTDIVNNVYDLFELTVPASLAGLPSVTLPGFAIRKADDFGLQLIGPRLSDPRLLSSSLYLSNSAAGGN